MVTEKELLDRAREMRRNPTELEIRVWRHLSNSQLGHKFRRQHLIHPYICDFFCPSKGLVVEIDGDTHDLVYDVRRDARISGLGHAVLRFTNTDVYENIEGVILTIATVLEQRPDRWSGMPHPNPSPEGEGLRCSPPAVGVGDSSSESRQK